MSSGNCFVYWMTDDKDSHAQFERSQGYPLKDDAHYNPDNLWRGLTSEFGFLDDAEARRAREVDGLSYSQREASALAVPVREWRGAFIDSVRKGRHSGSRGEVLAPGSARTVFRRLAEAVTQKGCVRINEQNQAFTAP